MKGWSFHSLYRSVKFTIHLIIISQLNKTILSYCEICFWGDVCMISKKGHLLFNSLRKKSSRDYCCMTFPDILFVCLYLVNKKKTAHRVMTLLFMLWQMHSSQPNVICSYKIVSPIDLIHSIAFRRQSFIITNTIYHLI